ncbi:MAG TPA: SGNH/GDSL hydrolase family protein [Oleiagrimonas sp.]|nr:SGNH/GDSL hydrolase family protein [Oleiagrimonas sp.]
MRFLALGDSYTIGEGVPESARWPVVLARQLRAAGDDVDDPHIIAVTGWTTDELSAGMDAATLEPSWDLVTLLIGVNNQYRGRDADNYRTEFGDLLQRAIGLADGKASHVLAVSIPDWGVTRFARENNGHPDAIAAAIDGFNAAAHEQVTAAGAGWADITDISRQCGAARDMLSDDGLHPSARQYTLWVPCILPLAHTIVRPL